MSRQYHAPRKYGRPRKYGGKCEKCGTPTPLSKTYQGADESNGSITYYAPYLCATCAGVKVTP
jgi:hypothetical protein